MESGSRKKRFYRLLFFDDSFLSILPVVCYNENAYFNKKGLDAYES